MLKRCNGVTSGIDGNNARRDHGILCAGMDLHNVLTHEERRSIGTCLKCVMVNGLRQYHGVNGERERHFVRRPHVKRLHETLETNSVAIAGSNDDAHSVC